MKKTIRITKGTGTWKVTQGGHSISRHQTQKEALDAAVRVPNKDREISVKHEGADRTSYKIFYIPYDKKFLSSQETKKAILNRTVPPSAGKPSVSRSKIAKAVQRVMRDSDTGLWVSRKSAN